MKRVLVIGGAGYLGGTVVDSLMNAGYNKNTDLTIYDNLTYENCYLKDCHFIFGDIRDMEHLLSIHKDYDEIIWLAAVVGDGACQIDPEVAKEVNTDCLCRFLDKTKRRIVFTSTSSVYGSQREILTEESPTNPLSVYASTKLEAEKCVLDNGGLVFRLGTLYGLGNQFSRIRFDLVVNTMVMRAIRDRSLTVFGGDQWRPIISVWDVAGYLVEAIANGNKGIYILSRKNIQIKELAKEIGNLFPKVVIRHTEMKFEDSRNYRVDTRKAMDGFSFRPNIAIKESVQLLASVIMEKRIRNLESPLFYNDRYLRRTN